MTQFGAEEFVPQTDDLDKLGAAVHECRGCDLYQDATQAVFGAGPPEADVVIVGEQPGDKEDRTGQPFVGPAGRLLDRALEQAGIDRERVYVTNAVKHFKFVPAERGKRRIHQKPSRGQILACRPWLQAELGSIAPELVIVLGSTAAQSLLGPSFRVTQRRGERIEMEVGEPPHKATVVATVHPSSILRTRDEDRKQAFAELLADLQVASKATR